MLSSVFYKIFLEKRKKGAIILIDSNNIAIYLYWEELWETEVKLQTHSSERY